MADDTPQVGSALPAAEPVISGPVQGESAVVRDEGGDSITRSITEAYERVVERAPNGQFRSRNDSARIPNEAELTKHSDA
jgi:hypothetical protein